MPKNRSPFNISMMPSGLLNALNEAELLDLHACMLSGGNPQDAMFTKCTNCHWSHSIINTL